MLIIVVVSYRTLPDLLFQLAKDETTDSIDRQWCVNRMKKFRALYPFQGDSFQGQLSFPAGAVLIVPDDSPAAAKEHNNGGWILGSLESNPGKQGWFPLSYVQFMADQSGVVMQPPAIGILDWTTRNKVEAPATGISVDNEDGFGGAPMGGEWKGSSTVTGGSAFGSSSLTNAPGSNCNSATTSECQAQPPPPARQAAVSVSTNPTRQGMRKRLSNATTHTRTTLSNVASRTGSVISNAASRTGTAISHTASRTGQATRQAASETGYRIRDMQGQHEQQLNQKAVTCTVTTHQTAAQSVGNSTTTTQQTSLAKSNGGILPGRRTDTTTTTTTQRNNPFGAATTTTTTSTTTSRPSGGFFPGIPGKTTTTQTVSRDDASGTPTCVQTHTQSRGGFYIVPLGPIGLAAAGALAAKHAWDSREDDREHQRQQQQQQQQQK